MLEPTADEIQQVQNITGCDEQVARRWLKVKSNNADAVLNAILDGEDLDKAETAVTWNESDFSADRAGNTTYGPQNYSYNEDNLRPLGHSAAPTRGNSPVPSLRQPSTRAEEDAAMQSAMAASQQHAGLPSHTSFGPATKDHYDPSNWAMTTTVPIGIDSLQQASEVLPDLEPKDRRNNPGEPRFLKPLPSGDYLPNLLTIAHSIPSARKALLAPYKVYSSYGSDSDWWKGHAIRLPRIVSTVSGSPVGPTNTEGDDLLAEVQRLVALLDGSARSYGSADSLVRLVSTGSFQPLASVSDSSLDRALQSWERAAEQADPERNGESGVFHSMIGTTSDEGLNTPHMWSLPLNVKADPDSTITLAEVMDSTLWDMDPDDATFCDNYMERCADVLPMRLTPSDSSKNTLGVVIPSSFYVDKYLKQNVDATRDTRKQMAQHRSRMDKIENVQYKLKNFKQTHVTPQQGATSLLKHTVDYFSGENRRLLMAERENNGAAGEADVSAQPDHHYALSERLNAVHNDIEGKFAALEQQKETTRKLLSGLSQNTPSELSPDSLKHRYSLRGVATKPHVTYVLRPRDPNDNDMVDDEDAPEGTQWWRIEYDVQANGARVLKTKSTQDDVIRAVELEHNQALLVYASDHAISDDAQVELPQALKNFIRQDDENFNEELQNNNFESGNLYHSRRGSGDSTIANTGDDDPPPYNDEFAANVPTSVGDQKDASLGSDSPPAHEIKLDDMHQEDVGSVEMVEKVHAPLYSLRDGTNANGSDDTMVGVEHIEELKDSKLD